MQAHDAYEPGAHVLQQWPPDSSMICTICTADARPGWSWEVEDAVYIHSASTGTVEATVEGYNLTQAVWHPFGTALVLFSYSAATKVGSDCC